MNRLSPESQKVFKEFDASLNEVSHAATQKIQKLKDTNFRLKSKIEELSQRLEEALTNQKHLLPTEKTQDASSVSQTFELFQGIDNDVNVDQIVREVCDHFYGDIVNKTMISGKLVTYRSDLKSSFSIHFSVEPKGVYRQALKSFLNFDDKLEMRALQKAFKERIKDLKESSYSDRNSFSKLDMDLKKAVVFMRVYEYFKGEAYQDIDLTPNIEQLDDILKTVLQEMSKS